MFDFVVDLLSRELKAKKGKLKLNCEETCSKHKEEEEKNPKQNLTKTKQHFYFCFNLLKKKLFTKNY